MGFSSIYERPGAFEHSRFPFFNISSLLVVSSVFYISFGFQVLSRYASDIL